MMILFGIILVLYIIGVVLSMLLTYIIDRYKVVTWMCDTLNTPYYTTEEKLGVLTYREWFKYGLMSWCMVLYVGIPMGVAGVAWCKNMIISLFDRDTKLINRAIQILDDKESWLDKTVTTKTIPIDDKDWHLAKVKKRKGS